MEEGLSQIVARADDEVIDKLDPEPSGGLAESSYYAMVMLGHRHALARFAPRYGDGISICEQCDFE